MVEKAKGAISVIPDVGAVVDEEVLEAEGGR
jgi:hypothetical protein